MDNFIAVFNLLTTVAFWLLVFGFIARRLYQAWDTPKRRQERELARILRRSSSWRNNH